MQLRLSRTTKHFDTRSVLRGIDLQIGGGEFLAVVGASGSGKSTLLRLLAGLDAADGGSILLDGEPLRGLNRAARVMFQEARLLPWRPVGTNAAIGAQPAAALAALEAVGLADRAADWPANLSGGQRQRVALARALASRPRLLLLDEPLASLDALTRIEMQGLIEDLWMRERFTAVLVTHDCAEAIALADRIVVLQAGVIAAEISVPLPRPRDRSEPEFARLEGLVLRLILERRDADDGSPQSETRPASAPGAISEALLEGEMPPSDGAMPLMTDLFPSRRG